MQIPGVVAAVLIACTAVAVVTVPWLVRSRAAARDSARGQRDATANSARVDRQLADTRADLDAVRRELAELTEELRHLTQTRLPALVTCLAHPHVPVPPLRAAHLAGSEVDELMRGVLDVVTSAVRDERIRVDEAAQDILRRTAAGSRTLSQQMQRILVDAQERTDDPRALEDLVRLDHLNERTKRLWQITAVACGDSTGLSRTDSHLEDLVAGAQSRIEGYQLVRAVNNLDAERRVGVVAHAAEPVAVILTELMANAAYFSTGTVPVTVELHETPTGALVVVDDAGPGMHVEDRAFADRMLSGGRRVLLTDLGSPPRLGFAGVGRLVREYPVTVTLSVSPYGGIRASVHIATDLLVPMDPLTHPVSAAAPVPLSVLRGRTRMPEPQAAAQPAGTAEGSLPRRRRQQPEPQPGQAEQSERTGQRTAGLERSVRAERGSQQTGQQPDRPTAAGPRKRLRADTARTGTRRRVPEPQNAERLRERYAGFQHATRSPRADDDPETSEGNPS